MSGPPGEGGPPGFGMGLRTPEEERVREAIEVLREDARDPERGALWRAGVKHALTIVERALGLRS